MLYRVLKKNEMERFLSRLLTKHEVIAPVKKRNTHVFDVAKKVEDIDLHYDKTLLPPKKLFLPPQETILEFRTDGSTKIRANTHAKSRIIFGLHPCDINGLLLLDRVFSEDYKDPYYLDKRAHSLVIGLGCMPGPSCFCQSMDTHEADKGFDLFFVDLGEDYLVKIGTGDGDNLLVRNAASRKVTEENLSQLRCYSYQRNKLFELAVDKTDLPAFIDLAFRSKVWKELGKKCLGCGACSYVCPTCYCMDVKDEISMNFKDAKRVRHWESCLLEEFAEVAGGFNFRKDRAGRYKHRFYHKHRGFVEKYGVPACVGCGRCIDACLANINVVEVMKTIRGEQSAEQKICPRY